MTLEPTDAELDRMISRAKVKFLEKELKATKEREAKILAMLKEKKESEGN